MKILIAPDKFKGSLTSFQVCEAISMGIKTVDKTIETLLFPMADGGDGFAAVMKYYLGTETVVCATEDPLGRRIKASYELKDGTAIIELASASGLVLLAEKEKNALTASTYGTGLMIKDAITKGALKIVLGLGGSATNDAGTGILAALGFQFVNKDGQPLKACGENLIYIDRIIAPAVLPEVSFDIACDVRNILYGEQGAAYVYAPQKGASAAEIVLLDEGLRHFAGLLRVGIADVPGTGAAGGIAAGLMGFFEVRLGKGMELVIATSGIGRVLPTADLVITGEGKVDNQSLYGKVIAEIAVLAVDWAIPVVAFCGVSEVGESDVKEMGLKAVYAIKPDDMRIEEAIAKAGSLLSGKAAVFIGTISP